MSKAKDWDKIQMEKYNKAIRQVAAFGLAVRKAIDALEKAEPNGKRIHQMLFELEGNCE